MSNVTHSQQPEFVIADAAYDRMLRKLENGSRFEWSYPGTCPHTRGPCTCPKFMNVLKDGKIIRIVNGMQKPVYKASEFLAAQQDDLKCEINVYFDRFERAGYATTLKELASYATFPVKVNIHMSDRIMTKNMQSMSEIETLIDGIHDRINGV